ncbi:MAG: hypothetical protein MK171_09405 [Pirellulales bacterium]|nr:hypothetical protein [Pirellulales bacterium]
MDQDCNDTWMGPLLDAMPRLAILMADADGGAWLGTLQSAMLPVSISAQMTDESNGL